MKKKSLLILFIALVLIVAIPFSLIACNKDEGVNDDDYTLVLSGLVDKNGNELEDISVTKAQLRQLFETKPVVHGSDDPVYASDKTDDDGNPIAHTVKGVYLEDVLAALTDSAGIEAYGTMTLNATDGYVTVITEEIFNSSGRGSKMILALEYDGVTLNPDEKSGAIRAVFPDQIANAWAKKLNKIEFSTELLKAPAITKFTALESLPGDLVGSYVGKVQLGGEEVSRTYYGYPIAGLIANGVLDAKETDKMHCVAWDYNSAANKFEEYSAWTKYEVYNGGWLLLEEEVDGQIIDLDRRPEFDGPDFSSGMTVKNVLSLSVYNNAIVCLEKARIRFAENNGNEFALRKLLDLLNMYDKDDDYIVTSPSGDTLTLTAEKVKTAVIAKENGTFVVKSGLSAVEVATVEKK